MKGSLVGPTYACLLGKQFANLRNCDRYWWETTDSVTGFANGNPDDDGYRCRHHHHNDYSYRDDGDNNNYDDKIITIITTMVIFITIMVILL